MSAAGFQAPIGDALEAHAGDVVAGCLLGVADVPVDMVVAAVAGDRGLAVSRGRRGGRDS